MSTKAEQSESVNFVIENNILKADVRSFDIERKLGQVILDALNESPNHVTQIDAESGKETTCAQMKDCSIRCALWLKKQGIGLDDIVVACTHNHLESYIPLFATFFVDAIFSAWNCDVKIHSARRYLKQFTPKVIFVCEKAVDVLVEASKLENVHVKLVVFGANLSSPSLMDIMNVQREEEVDNFKIVNIKSPDDLVYITLSSGSTGLSKGVMLSCKALLASVMIKSVSFDTSLKVLIWYWSFDTNASICNILQTIMEKQTRIIPTRSDVENFFEIIEKYQVNWAGLPGNFVTYAANSDVTKNYNLDSLKTVFVVGRRFGEDELKALQRNIPKAFIRNLYGSTEIGIIANGTPACKHIESVGFIATNVRVRFVDLVNCENLGPKQHGEIRAKSPAAMIGYYNNPEETKEAFDKDGWYRTGDIGYYDETGEIFIVDRIKEMMKFQSHHVSPAEIEEILLSHPGVEEALVVPLPHEIDGDWPTAFCKTKLGHNVTVDELMSLTSVLEDYKKLRGGIHFIDSFTYTSSGKIARNEMKLLAKKLIKIVEPS